MAVHGRDDWMARLEADLAVPCPGAVVGVEGAPLSGRSTVWETIVGRAADADQAVLATRAVASDAARPRATLQRLVSRWVDVAEGGPGIRAARGLHALEALAPNLGDRGEPADPARLQAELSALIGRLARQCPVLVALDDAHHADPETRAVLQGAATAQLGAPVAFLTTRCPGDAEFPALAGRVHRLPPLPDLTVDVVLRRATDRLRALPDSARHVLEVLAVADRDVEEDVLLRASGLDEGAFDDALDTLERRQWVHLRESGPVLIIGALAPAWLEAVRHRLSQRRRRALHQAWLRAPVDPLAELHHTRQAGTRADEGAVERLRGAGRRALDERRYAEATELLSAARDLALRRDGCSAELWEEVGLAARFGGEPDTAGESWEAGLQAAPAPATRARLRRLLAMLAWDREDIDGAFGHLRQGWRELRGHGGTDVETLMRTDLMFTERMLDVPALERSTERLAEVALTADARATVWHSRAATRMYRGGPGALDAAHRALEEAADATDPQVVERAHHIHRISLLVEGRPADVTAALERRPPHAYYGYSQRGFLAMLTGDLGLVDDIAEDLTRNPSAYERMEPMVRAMRETLTASATAEERLERVLATAPRPRTRMIARWLQAALYDARGEHDRVLQVIHDSGMVRDGAIVVPMPLEVIRLVGIAQIRTGQLEEAEATARRAEEWNDYGADVAALLRAEIARARREPAAEALEACAEAFAARGMAPLAAMAQGWAAEAWGRAEVERAKGCLDAAWAEWTRLGLDPALARGRALYEALGLTVPGTPRRGTTDGPLSERELEVVRLVARGMTNKEVAAALFLSHYTVGTHLKRVYQRLGIHNRAALTRWAAEHGYLSAAATTPADRSPPR